MWWCDLIFIVRQKSSCTSRTVWERKVINLHGLIALQDRLVLPEVCLLWWLELLQASGFGALPRKPLLNGGEGPDPNPSVNVLPYSLLPVSLDCSPRAVRLWRLLSRFLNVSHLIQSPFLLTKHLRSPEKQWSNLGTQMSPLKIPNLCPSKSSPFQDSLSFPTNGKSISDLQIEDGFTLTRRNMSNLIGILRNWLCKPIRKLA